MVSYYTALIALCWMSLCVLCILVQENSWIPENDKRRFYLTYAIIAFSALAEWVGIQLSGNTRVPAWVLALVKCVDYMLTPFAGWAIVAQMKLRNRWNRALTGVLAFNTVFQILALFNGWMVTIDAQNNYAHGPLYLVYVVVYMLVIVVTGVEFLLYGRSYRRQNRTSLYAVLLLVLVGIGLQEMFGGEFRTAYIALTMGAGLMFIHYSEFYQMTADEHIRRQHSELMRDALSGALSRHAYMKDLERYADQASIPEDLTAFTIDINGLKAVNDTLGHDAGDELIVGAAGCVSRAVGDTGRCYRTGGDEFVVLARMDRTQADTALLRLDSESAAWKGEKVGKLSLSAGCALARDHRGLTGEELVKKADQAMYAAKAEYYRVNGRDRRARR